MPVKIIPVIMCGGAGTRLWPVSRESMPKQFVPLIGSGLDLPAGDDARLRPERNSMALSFVHEVEAFVEKPDAETAAKYVADQYLWNSGNFLFSAATMWEEIEQLEPLMAEAAKASIAASTRGLDFLRLTAEPFARAPHKTIY